MFGWWHRKKEWPLLDGEELLYTDRSGRFAVTTQRFRARKSWLPVISRFRGNVLNLALEDVNSVSVKSSLEPSFLFLIGIFSALLLFGPAGDLLDRAVQGFLLYPLRVRVGLQLILGFVCLCGLFWRFRLVYRHLYVVCRGLEVHWNISNLSAKEAGALRRELQSARGARRRVLAAKEDEAGRFLRSYG